MKPAVANRLKERGVVHQRRQRRDHDFMGVCRDIAGQRRAARWHVEHEIERRIGRVQGPRVCAPSPAGVGERGDRIVTHRLEFGLDVGKRPGGVGMSRVGYRESSGPTANGHRA